METNMKKLITLLTVIVFSCKVELPPVMASSAVVSFSINQPEFRSNQTSNATDWMHILPDSMQIIITNRNTGTTIEKWLKTDQENNLVLPNGSYLYQGKSAQPLYSDFLPISFDGIFAVRGEPLNINIEANTQHALLTLDPSLIKSANISGNQMNELNGFYYKYVKGSISSVLQIEEDVYSEIIEKDITINSLNHFHYKMEIVEGEQSASISIQLSEFEYTAKTIMISLRKTYDVLAGKLVTLMAEAFEGYQFDYWAMDGQTVSNEIEYSFIMPDKDIDIIGHFKRN
jgi:hypothetical protein